MPTDYCFLCASDDGVFLDITAENKKIFHEQLEACLLVKASNVDNYPSKICHKCAYELNQCSSFVQKYKKSCTLSGKKFRKTCCCICSEPAKKGYLFDLSKDSHPEHNPFIKIRKIFDHDFEEQEEENKLICLTCRYSLDVLFDLKSIFQETTSKLKTYIKDEIDYLNLHKTQTIVVSRKTTSTESARINLCMIDSDSDSSTMARGQSRITKLRNDKSSVKMKLRNCNKCHNSVENGSDMYRFHRTGLTVCKNCWITMDPSVRNNRKRTRQNQETKLCTVFLKDVLTDTKEKIYRVEEDSEGNKVFIVTDDTSESESKSQGGSPKSQKPVSDDNGSDIVKRPKRAVKSAKSESTDSEDKPRKRLRFDEKQNNESLNEVKTQKQNDTKDPTYLPITRHTRKAALTNRNSDSEVVISQASERITRKTMKLSRNKPISYSDAEAEERSNRKKLKTILEGIPMSLATVVNKESLSNENGSSTKKKTKIIGASSSITEQDNRITKNKKRTRSGSISGKETTPPRQFRAPIQKRLKPATTVATKTSSKSQSTDSDEMDSSDETKIEKNYVCSECGGSYENKLEGMTHKLSHFKQLEVKLHKVILENITPETDPSNKTQSMDEQNEDPSEHIQITVEDDEDETVVDMTSLSVTQSEEIQASVSTDKISFSQKDADDDREEDAVDINLVTEDCKRDHDQEITKAEAVSLSTEELREEKGSENVANESSMQEASENLNVTSPRDNRSDRKSSIDSTEDKDSCRTIKKESENVDKSDKVDLCEKEEIQTEEIQRVKSPKIGSDNEKTEKDNIEEEEAQENAVKKIKPQNSEVDMKEIKVNETENESIQEVNEDETQKIVTETKESQVNAEQESKEQCVTEEMDKQTNKVQNQELKEDNIPTKEVQLEVEKPTTETEDVETTGIQKRENDTTEKDIELIKDVDATEVENIEVKSDCQKSAGVLKTTETPSTDDVCKISKKEEENNTDDKEVESETDIKIVDTGSSEESIEPDIPKTVRTIESGTVDDKKDGDADMQVKEQLPNSSKTKPDKDVEDSSIVNSVERQSETNEVKFSMDSENAAAEALQEVFELANAEVQKRRDNLDTKDNNEDPADAETLENISREIHNSADMPSLEPISATEPDEGSVLMG